MQEISKKVNELRNAAEGSPVMSRIGMLFDQLTFVQTGVFTKRNSHAGSIAANADELEGVVTGYGAVNGELVYVFAQDGSRMNGAIDDNSAKKIENLYRLALTNGAPVVGIFDCGGADVHDGVSAMAAYAKILGCVSEASGVIPQIAVITGKCTGTMAAVAAMFDFAVETESSQWYVTSPALNAAKNAAPAAVSKNASEAECFAYVRTLVSGLPAVCDASGDIFETADDPNRVLQANVAEEGIRSLIDQAADIGSVIEVNGDCGSVVCAFAAIGGISCAIAATDSFVNEGRISSYDARKLAKFVCFCDAYSIPLITIVDSKGVVTNAENEHLFASDLARLAQAYSDSAIPMVSVITGCAIGAAYILLGSKAVGADLVYAFENAEIGTVEAKTAVAFTWNEKIKNTSREDLEAEWKDGPASALTAATHGEIDDIITPDELRARLSSALYMLRGSALSTQRRRPVDAM